MRDSYMKILVERAFFAAVLVFSAVLSADVVSDRHLVFWTNGPDRYADGSSVQNGECYALVCTKAGAAFAGFNADGSVRDYRVLKQAETPGLGSKMEMWFRDPAGARSVIGKNPETTPFYVTKDKEQHGAIDGITAATISSRAFLESMRDAYQAYKQFQEKK